MSAADFVALARRLERSPDHRVLRRVTVRDVFAAPEGETRLGVLLDTETTASTGARTRSSSWR